MNLKSSFIEEFLSDLRRLFSKGYHKTMDPMEASAKSTDPEEVIDLQDDHLMHRDDDVQPEPEQVLDEVLTNDIEKDPPVVKAAKAKRPRTKAQQEAFKKAQLALKAKREKERQEKDAKPKKARGRPTLAARQLPSRLLMQPFRRTAGQLARTQSLPTHRSATVQTHSAQTAQPHLRPSLR